MVKDIEALRGWTPKLSSMANQRSYGNNSSTYLKAVIHLMAILDKTSIICPSWLLLAQMRSLSLEVPIQMMVIYSASVKTLHLFTNILWTTKKRH